MLELAREAVNEQEAMQKAPELAAFGQYLIENEVLRPDDRAPNPLRTIVEIGSYRGGTLWFWRRVAPAAKIIGIDRHVDCPDCSRRRAHANCPRARIRQNASVFLEADSRDPGTVRDVAQEVGLTLEDAYGGAMFPEGAGIDLLFIDGDHSQAGIEGDFQAYVPLLSGPGVVAIHDVAGATPAQIGDGVLTDAVQRFWHNIEKTVPQAFSIVKDEGGPWGGIGVLPKPK